MNQEEEQDGFDLEQATMANLRDLDELPSKQGGMNQWSSQFELSPTAASFELRPFQNDLPYTLNPIVGGPPHIQQQHQLHQSHPGGGNQVKSHSQTSPPGRHQQQLRSSTNTLSLAALVVERNDYKEAAEFFIKAKHGNDAAAQEFVRTVLSYISSTSAAELPSAESPDWDNQGRSGHYATSHDQAASHAQLAMNQHTSILLQSGVPPRPPPIVPISLIGDEIDERASTLVILVPGRAHIVGHLIGKGGAEVGRIEQKMLVTIKIEAATKLGVQLVERSVCITGSVGATTQAQQLVSHKVHEKLLSEGVQAEVLKMVVPNEIVRHLIGKSGSNINRLQNESGARIQVEPESTMTPGSVGRTIVLQGAERCRTLAQYLILRQIAEDRNVHTEWAGRIHTTGGSSSPTMSPNAPLSPSGPGGGPQITPGMASSGSVRGPVISPNAPNDEFVAAFSVPEAAVAFLIGRNGASVTEIQNHTGARVHIARSSNGKEIMMEDRKVTVSGTSRAVEAARQMIRSRVQIAISGGVASPQHAQPYIQQHSQQ